MRYGIAPRPRAWLDYDGEDAAPVNAPSIEVESTNGPRFTGIVDPDGQPIYSYPPPIGFRFQDND